MSIPVFKYIVPGSCPIEKQKEERNEGRKREERERKKRERKNEGRGKERNQEIKRVSEVWKRQRRRVYREKKQHAKSSKTWKPGETGLLN